MTGKAPTKNDLPASFYELVRRRSRLAWILTLLLFSAFALNLALMSFAADLGAQAVASQGLVNVATLVSVGIVFAGSMVAAFYAWWAARRIDPLRDEVRKELVRMSFSEEADNG